MNKHTPGPWYVTEEMNDGGDVLYSVEADGLPVADIYRKAEHEANARLIATAPDMYTLLRDMVEIFEGYDAEADCDPFTAKEFFKNLAEEFLVDAHEILSSAEGKTE